MSTLMPDRVSGIVQKLREIEPLIEAQRASFDQERRLPDAVFEALADAGLFRIWWPEALGGPQLSPLAFMDIVEAAAALDGSVGWLVGNGGGMSRAGGYLPQSVAGTWLSGRLTFIASATGAVGDAVPVDGGFRVSGRWPFASGAHHASHFMGLASVKDRSGVEHPPLCCYLARSDVEIHDAWHVSGLRGTGSCDFEAKDRFVPTAHTHPFVALAPSQPGVIYRLPPVSVFSWTVSVVPLGIARGAIATFTGLAARKARAGLAALLRDREIVQAAVGRAEATHRAARAFLREAMGELIAANDDGGERLIAARSMLRVACAHAAESALAIVEGLAANAGAIAIFESCRLERALRDVQAAVKHVAMGPHSYIVAGRMALGLDPGTARF